MSHYISVRAFQVSGTWDGRVMLWDLFSGGGKLVKEWASHNERVWAVSMDDFHVVSAGLDKSVCVRSFLPDDLRFARWDDSTRCSPM